MPKPLFRQRHGHACAQSLWKGGEPLFAGDGYAGVSPTGPQLHWRYSQARPGAVRLCGPDHQLLQTFGAGLRSPGQPRLFQPQSLRRRAHSDVLAESEGETDRVPLPRPLCNAYLAFAA